MKIGFYQPSYPVNHAESLKVMKDILEAAVKNSEGLDLFVLPEYSNVPGITSMDSMLSHMEKYNDLFLDSLINASKDNKVCLAVNMLIEENGEYFNTTVFIDRNGNIAKKYKKTHLSYTESQMGISPGKSIETITIDGIRISFATCFELYFPEYFEAIAHGRPDLIICPSYQRSESSEVIVSQAKVRALDTESYIIRVSYSMGEQSDNGGNSLIASPNGSVIINANQDTGFFKTNINTLEKRVRPVSFGEKSMTSREIIERFRLPKLYRTNTGFFSDENKYPRICAHRGLSLACPENTLPAFAAAISLGAHEIEYDLWPSKDGQLIVSHDPSLDRTTDIKGNIESLTLEEIKKADAGIKTSKEWKGTKIPTAEEVFGQFSSRTIMNIHIKDPGPEGYVIRKIAELAEKYGNTSYIYISGDKYVLDWALKLYPHIERNCLESQEDSSIIEWAQRYKCKRLQFFTNYTDEMIRKAKELNMICNLFYSDDPDEAKMHYSRGIDTILTNCTNALLSV